MKLNMKRTAMIAAMCAAFTWQGTALAGGNHSHDKDGGHSHHGHSHGEVAPSRIASKASGKLFDLIKRGKIPASWENAELVSVEKKTFKKGDEWVASYKNPQISEGDKQVLYFFYSLDGHYIAVNYSGK